jgi:c-di-GMP-binding flagellar brake protein YcgR
MNRRRYQRTPAQYFTKFAFINDKLSIQTPPGFNRGVIENISFGGISMLAIPELPDGIRKMLTDGKLNVYLDFNLPPSLKQIEITGKVKWTKEKKIPQAGMTVLGIEFINKNKVLFKEIDDFIKTDGNSPLLKNKRRFTRIPLDITVKFTIKKYRGLGLFTKVYEGFLKDLSAGGMSITVTPALSKNYADNLLARRKYLFLKFFLPDFNKFFNLTGVATRITPGRVKDRPSTVIGVKFINMSEPEQHGIIEYVSLKKTQYVKEEAPGGKKAEPKKTA